MGRINTGVAITLGVLVLVCGGMAGLAGYWRSVNQLPEYPTLPAIRPPVPNAYDDFVAAGRLCRAEEGSAGTDAAGRSKLAWMSANSNVPTRELRRVLFRCRPALARLRQGLHHSSLYPLPLTFSSQFPELSDFRELARLLVVEGKLAEREGRPNAATRCYLDCLRLGAAVPRGGGLIHGLVGIAIHLIGLRALEQDVDRLDGPTAAAATREMARLEGQTPMEADALGAEKEVVTRGMLTVWRGSGGAKSIVYLLTGSPAGVPSPAQKALELKLLFTSKRRIFDSFRGYMDALAVSSRLPYYAAPNPPVPNDPLTPILAAAYAPASFRWTTRLAHWRIIELRLAARAYQQRYRTPPPSAAALVPAYLPAVPQDPFAPAPLVYRRRGNRVLIYSRGPDGKDDGGVDLGARVEAGSQGDIVTLKPPKRR